MRFIDREEVSRRLTYDVCIPIVRDAINGVRQTFALDALDEGLKKVRISIG